MLTAPYASGIRLVEVAAIRGEMLALEDSEAELVAIVVAPIDCPDHDCASDDCVANDDAGKLKCSW